MAKARLSVGTDTPTGEPAHGPPGPYITDEQDDEVAAATRRSSGAKRDEGRGGISSDSRRTPRPAASTRTSRSRDDGRRPKGPAQP